MNISETRMWWRRGQRRGVVLSLRRQWRWRWCFLLQHVRCTQSFQHAGYAGAHNAIATALLLQHACTSAVWDSIRRCLRVLRSCL